MTKQHNIEPMKPEMLPKGPFQKVAVYFKGPFYDVIWEQQEDSWSHSKKE